MNITPEVESKIIAEWFKRSFISPASQLSLDEFKDALAGLLVSLFITHFFIFSYFFFLFENILSSYRQFMLKIQKILISQLKLFQLFLPHRLLLIILMIFFYLGFENTTFPLLML